MGRYGKEIALRAIEARKKRNEEAAKGGAKAEAAKGGAKTEAAPTPDPEFDKRQALYQEAKALGEEAASLQDNIVAVEAQLKAKQEEIIQANKTFAHVFLNKPLDLEQVEKEKKEITDKLNDLRAKYKTKTLERDEARKKLEDAKVVVTPEISKEKKRELTPVEKKIASQLERYRIKQEEFEKIPGIEKLTDGQKALVLENLGQLTLGRIQDEAYDKVEKDIQSSGPLLKFWKGITKQYQIASSEKKTGKEILEGGMKTHGKILEKLVAGASLKESPDARINEKTGEVEMLYVSGLENLTSKEQKAVDKYNEVASAWTKIPKEWGLESAKVSEKRKYEKAAKQYEKAKRGIVEVLVKQAEANKVEREQVKQALITMESQVAFSQYLNTHPDVEKMLGRIEDDRAWTQALKDHISEKGLIFGMGFALRTGSMIGLKMTGAAALPYADLLAIPGVGSVVGGIVARWRGYDTLRREERKIRGGEKGAQFQDMEKRFVKASAENVKVTRGGKEKPLSLAIKLEDLVAKAENASDPKERRKLMDKLKLRLDYTQNKLDRGLVIFGKDLAEQVENDVELRLALARAVTLVGAYSGYKIRANERKLQASSAMKKKADAFGPWDKKKEEELENIRKKLIQLKPEGKGDLSDPDAQALLSKEDFEKLTALRAEHQKWFHEEYQRFMQETPEERLVKILITKEEAFQGEKGKHLRNEMLKGAAMGAAFAFAGRTVASYVPVDKLLDWVSEKTGWQLDFRKNQSGNASEKGVHSKGSSTDKSSSDSSKIVTDKKGESKLDGVVVPRTVLEPQNEANMKAGQDYLTANPADQAQIREVTGMTDEELKEWGQKGNAAAETALQERSDAASTEAPKLAEGVMNKLEGYKFQSGDTLSGLIASQIPEGTPGRAEKIASIYNLIQEKANGMIPDELKDTGLRSGDVNKIYAGETFHVSKFVSAEEIQKIIEGEYVGSKAPGGENLDQLAQKIGSTREPMTETFPDATSDDDGSAAEAVTQEDPLSQVTVRAETREIMGGLGIDRVKAYVEANPDILPELGKKAGILQAKLFNTQEAIDAPGYFLDHEALGKVRVKDALNDIKLWRGLDREEGAMLESQKMELERFTKAAEKTYGRVARPTEGVSVGRYMRLIAVLEHMTGKSVPGY